MIVFKNVSKSYGRVKALTNINFEVNDGEFVYLTGPSGSGKTSILKIILREIIPDSGQVLIDNIDIAKIASREVPVLRQSMGVVFQDFKVLTERTVFENVEIALAVLNVSEDEWDKRVEHVLKLVGLIKRRNMFPSQLSGGELQRVSLARALVVNPKIILADEPTGNLDWETADGIMDLFEKINNEGKSIIMATHHAGILKKYKHRVIEIKDGKIIKN